MAQQSKTKQIILCAIMVYVFFLAVPEVSKGNDDVVTIVAAGDIYLGGSADNYLKQKGYLYPFEATKDILKNADITVANLEAPLTNKTAVFMEKEYILKHNPDAVGAIKAAGFNVVTLANNHIMDYGPDGLKETIDLLNKAGIKHTGAGENLKSARVPAVVNIKSKRIAFLAYSLVFPEEFYATDDSSGTAKGIFENVISDIKNIKKHADIIILSFHWSEELMKYPKEYQIELAHRAIDNGANLIIGHHPHVIQGIEKYKDGLIFYSLGNFVFGSVNRSIPEGMLAVVRFSQHNKVISAEIIPLDVNNKEVLFQPKPLQTEKADIAIKNIQEISSRFQTRLTVEQGKGYLQLTEEFKVIAVQR
jgi:poly-gamma-glutamate synthesis protein (capsule biosynthesis protein)